MEEDQQNTTVIDYVVTVGFNSKTMKEDSMDLSKLEFVPVQLKRFPETDSKDFPLPQLTALFCFPNNITLSIPDRHSETFSFIMTNEKGLRFFGFALIQYCPLQEECLKTLNELTKKEYDIMHYPVALCFISRFPFHNSFYIFFVEWHKKFEKTMFSDETPRKVFQKLAFAFPKKNQSTNTCLKIGTKSIIFSKFTKNATFNFPRVDVDFSTLFKRMSVKSILHLFACILTEGQIIFLSDAHMVLTSCIETLLAFAYPFEFTFLLVPILPKQLYHFLAAPIPYIIGTSRTAFAKSYFGLEEDALAENILIVDLDNNSMVMTPNHKMSSKNLTEVEKKKIDKRFGTVLPEKYQKKLYKRLKLFKEYCLHKYSNESQANEQKNKPNLENEIKKPEVEKPMNLVKPQEEEKPKIESIISKKEEAEIPISEIEQKPVNLEKPALAEPQEEGNNTPQPPKEENQTREPSKEGNNSPQPPKDGNQTPIPPKQEQNDMEFESDLQYDLDVDQTPPDSSPSEKLSKISPISNQTRKQSVINRKTRAPSKLHKTSIFNPNGSDDEQEEPDFDEDEDGDDNYDGPDLEPSNTMNQLVEQRKRLSQQFNGNLLLFDQLQEIVANGAETSINENEGEFSFLDENLNCPIYLPSQTPTPTTQNSPSNRKSISGTTKNSIAPVKSIPIANNSSPNSESDSFSSNSPSDPSSFQHNKQRSASIFSLVSKKKKTAAENAEEMALEEKAILLAKNGEDEEIETKCWYADEDKGFEDFGDSSENNDVKVKGRSLTRKLSLKSVKHFFDTFEPPQEVIDLRRAFLAFFVDIFFKTPLFIADEAKELQRKKNRDENKPKMNFNLNEDKNKPAPPPPPVYDVLYDTRTFRKEDFLNECSNKNRKFLKAFVETQMFSFFVQRESSPLNSNSLFERTIMSKLEQFALQINTLSTMSRTGFVHKLGRTIKNWKYRFFVINSRQEIRYFTSASKKQQKGKLKLIKGQTTITIIKSNDSNSSYSNFSSISANSIGLSLKSCPTPFVFIIRTPERKLVCATSTAEEREEWVRILKAKTYSTERMHQIEQVLYEDFEKQRETLSNKRQKDIADLQERIRIGLEEQEREKENKGKEKRDSFKDQGNEDDVVEFRLEIEECF